MQDLGGMDEAMCNLGYDVQISMLGPALMTIPPFCKTTHKSPGVRKPYAYAIACAGLLLPM